jgi:capsid protein
VREDAHIRGPAKRQQLQETAAELSRNLSLAAWMVRRHLDYVASFKFRVRTPDEEFNREVERLMMIDGLPSAADVSGRFDREKLFRLAELRRVLDGDCLLVKQSDGRLQGVQGDLVRDPEDKRVDEEWINGVKINSVGRPLAFGIYSRKGYVGTEYVRRLNARNAIFYGFFDRFATDQVRGVSPLVAALAPLQDVYENFTYALAKSKVSQLLALAFYREADTAIGDIRTLASEGQRDDNEDDVAEARKYSVDFGGGPQVFNLDPGDRAEFIESKNPSSEFQAFTQLIIQVALKALDIPYSFYDESHTNFFGSRAAWQHYERSCQAKRDDQKEMRRQYTIWKLQQWIASGRLTLPGSMTLRDAAFEWVAVGMPFWDPAKEIRGHVAAIKNGLDTPQRITRSTGTDFYENVDEIALAIEYAKEKNVPLEFAVELTSDAIAAQAEAEAAQASADAAETITDAEGN